MAALDLIKLPSVRSETSMPRKAGEGKTKE
jgi:hypothetical protein